MKKRITQMVALLLSVTLLFIGCSGRAQNKKVETDANTQNVEETASSDNQDTTDDDWRAESEEIDVPDVDVNSMTGKGGSPWTDSDLKSNVANSTRPSEKEDFHWNVNYEWLKDIEIAGGTSAATTFGEVQQKTDEKAIALLTDNSVSGHDAELVQTMYGTIMDWKTRNSLGMEPIRGTVDAIAGISSLNELTAFLSDPDKSGDISVFFYIANDIGISDPEYYILMIESEGFCLGDMAEYKTRTAAGEVCYNAKKDEAVTLLTRLGYSDEEAVSMYQTLIAVEGRLAVGGFTNAQKFEDDYFDKVNNVYDTQAYLKTLSSFPLKEILDGYGFGNAKQILIVEPEMLKIMDSLYSEDHLEDIKTALIVRYVLDSAEYLDENAYLASIKMKNTITGGSGRVKDRKEAFDEIRGALSGPMGHVYVQKYGSKKQKKEISTLSKSIIAQWRKMLSNEDWLTKETKKAADEKLKSMEIMSCYPDKWEDYSGLSLDGLNYIETIKAINIYNSKLNAAKTNQPVDKSLADVDILTANAYYNVLLNSFIITIGIMQSPFYEEGMEKEELYAGIGSIVAHEVSHAFDTNGAKFDKNGRYVNWWTKADYRAFDERAQKLEEYYDNIIAFDGYHIPGGLVRTEAIADIAGVKTMLGIAKSEKNFDYDRFFRSYAVVWRGLITPKAEAYYLMNDEHPLDYLRTNVTLQQFDEFLETYDIKEGDGMYLAPDERISVW